MQTFSLGYSPCPNDTFIFHALTHGLVSRPGFSFTERLEDVETLNRLVLDKALDVSKISYHLLGFVRDDYCLLTSGGALGRGCGPLVVSKNHENMAQLKGKRIALPGRYTTAALLLRLFDPSLTEIVYLPFDRIMDAIADGSVDAGVIIHESRFTYAALGLVKLLDLGDWWEKETGHPIPLGGIVAKRSLGGEAIAAINTLLRESVECAFAAPLKANAYIRAHSQEMSDEVCAAHIKLYVNDFSRDLGQEGKAAVSTLMGRAEAHGLVPLSAKDIFLP
ncbi:1,4-dihydroxy-6-naphthoate synthase [Geotalea sp. SG265]|uniref:1,4-dihydroxy-6-naphthoate synthase n=1 Tax=Geotalea sp. SG265 TaxID=2922867 RepID=UPI001FAF19BD|nr:1,4-dihydroxy-6-naphthoate synthase [Geotalea sp. SG265]